MKVLKKVKDRFSILNDGRRLGANNRKYLIDSVKAMLNSPETQERLRLGEAYGYYGHSPRERSNKLIVGETEVVYINGKPVVVENVPACRTVNITIDDDGIVTHEQEILDTPTGEIVARMIDSKAGGWSWATSGFNSMRGAVARLFAGVDYVLRPNYISLDHPQMMLESADDEEQLLLESLSSAGVDGDSIAAAIRIGMQDSHLAEKLFDLEQETLILESVITDRDSRIAKHEQVISELESNAKAVEEAEANREKLFLEAADSFPLYLTDEQKSALVKMQSQDDLKTVQLLFESLRDGKFHTLPIGQNAPESNIPLGKDFSDVQNHTVDFGMASRRFG